MADRIEGSHFWKWWFWKIIQGCTPIFWLLFPQLYQHVHKGFIKYGSAAFAHCNVVPLITEVAIQWNGVIDQGLLMNSWPSSVTLKSPYNQCLFQWDLENAMTYDRVPIQVFLLAATTKHGQFVEPEIFISFGCSRLVINSTMVLIKNFSLISKWFWWSWPSRLTSTLSWGCACSSCRTFYRIWTPLYGSPK